VAADLGLDLDDLDARHGIVVGVLRHHWDPVSDRRGGDPASFIGTVRLSAHSRETNSAQASETGSSTGSASNR